MFPSTLVTFPYSSDTLTATVLAVQPHADSIDIVTDITPFHPVSHIWPDQPADKGELYYSGQTYPVTDCFTGVVEHATGQLYVHHDIPVKRNESGWSFVVVHRINHSDANIACHDSVELSIDKEYQTSLSLAHTAEHLVSMALNKVLHEQGYWRKEADRKDPLGHYHFHNYAQEASRITPYAALVSYRLGKTLRKRGLNTHEMMEDLTSIIEQVNAQLALWIAHSGKIELICEGDTLTDSRYWQCYLQDDLVAKMPCGGTHATHLGEYKVITASVIPHDSLHFELQTHVDVS